MNKIYIGDQEIGTGSSGGGSVINPSDYVDASTWDAHEKVIASALVDLKTLEDQIEAFDESIQAQENALLAEVQAVEVAKADASTVYTKSDIDKSDKVVAAALAELNERVSTLETSSGSGSSSGDGSFDPTDVNSSISDISTRVNAIETDYVVSNDISTFVTQSALDSSYVSLESSIIALDASALAFDASIKELASAGGSSGGSSFDPTDINSSISDISTRVGTIETDYVVSNDLSTFLTDNDISTYYKKNDSFVVFGAGQIINSTNGQAYVLGALNNFKNNGYGPTIILGTGNKVTTQSGASYHPGLALGLNNTIDKSGVCIGLSNNTDSNDFPIAIGYYNTVKQSNSIAIGQSNTSGKGWSYIFGDFCKTSNYYEIAVGRYNYTSNVANTSTHFSIGNGAADSSRHNALEVRQSGDIYVADVSASGEYYEKPMINLQEKLYALDASIQAVAGGSGGGSSTDLTGYVYVDNNILKKKESSGQDSRVDSLTIDSIETSTITSVDKNNTNDAIIFADGLMFVRSGNITYQIDLASFCEQFGNEISVS